MGPHKAPMKGPQMTQTLINPWPWSLPLGYSQGALTTQTTRHLTIAGQTAVDATGAPQHAGDMRAQLALALDNLETVLRAAQMDLRHLTRLTIYSTNVDETLAALDLLGMRLGPLGLAPPLTLLGVTRLALPGLLVEIEAVAAA